MLESTITSLIQRILGDFLSINDLSFGLMQGEIKLKNIQLKPNVLSPLRLVDGSVKNFEAHIGNPIKIILEDLQMVVADEFTIKKVSNEELKQKKIDTLNTHEMMQKPQQPGYLSGMMMNVVNNIHIDINKIYIEFRSGKSIIIIELSRLAIVNSSDERKLLALEGLSIKMKYKDEEIMILEPVHASGTMGITKDYSLDISLPDINLKLPRDFYVELMRITEHLHMMFLKQAQPFVQERPMVPIKGNARKWWTYYLVTVTHKINKKRKEWDFNNMKLFRDRWRAYSKLWTNKAQNLAFDAEQLKLLETVMDTDVILWIRDMVKADIELQRRQHPEPQGWLAWISGAQPLVTDITKDKAAAKNPRQAEPPSAKKIKATFNIITFKMKLIQDNKAFEVNCRNFIFDLDYANHIIDAKVTLMDMGVIDNFTENNKYPMMVTPYREKMIAGKVANLQDTNEQLLEMKYKYDPNRQTPSDLSIHTSALVVIFQPSTVYNLTQFFKVPQLPTISDSSVDEFKAYSKAGLQFAIETHRQLNIDFTLSAPCILIPNNDIFMAVNMGILQVNSKLTSFKDEDLNKQKEEELLGMIYDHYIFGLQGIQFGYHTDINKALNAAMNDDVKSCNILNPSTLKVDFQKAIINVDKAPEYKMNIDLDKIEVHMSPLKLKYLLMFEKLFEIENAKSPNIDVEEQKSKLPKFDINFKIQSFICHFDREEKILNIEKYSFVSLDEFEILIQNSNEIHIYPKMASLQLKLNDHVLACPFKPSGTILTGEIRYSLENNDFKSDLVCEGIHFDMTYLVLQDLFKYLKQYQIDSKKATGESKNALKGALNTTVKDVKLTFSEPDRIIETFFFKASGFKLDVKLDEVTKIQIDLDKFIMMFDEFYLMDNPNEGLLQCKLEVGKENIDINGHFNKSKIYVTPELMTSLSILMRFVDLFGDEKSASDSDSSDGEKTKYGLNFDFKSPSFVIPIDSSEFTLDFGLLSIANQEDELNKFFVKMNGAQTYNQKLTLFREELQATIDLSITPLMIAVELGPTKLMMNHDVYVNFMHLLDVLPAISEQLNNPHQKKETNDDEMKFKLGVKDLELQLLTENETCELFLEDLKMLLTMTKKMEILLTLDKLKGTHLDSVFIENKGKLLNLKYVSDEGTMIDVDMNEMTAYLDTVLYLNILDIFTLPTPTNSSQESVPEASKGDSALSGLLLNWHDFKLVLNEHMTLTFDQFTTDQNEKSFQLSALNIQCLIDDHQVFRDFNIILNLSDKYTISIPNILLDLNVSELLMIQNTVTHEYALYSEHTTESQGPATKTVLAVIVDKVHCTINDNVNGYQFPLFQIGSSCQLEATMTSYIKAQLNLSLDLAIFNPSIWSFEPFIESTEFNLTMDDNKIFLSNEKLLNINVSPNLVRGLFDIQKLLTTDVKTTNAPFMLYNQIGSPITVSSDLFSKYVLEVIDKSELLLNTYTESIYMQLNLKYKDNPIEIQNIIINKDKKHLIELVSHGVSKAYLIINIMTVNHHKQIYIQTPYYYTNKTSDPVDILLTKRTITIKPMETICIPLDHVEDRLKFKLNAPSLHVIYWKDYLQGQTRAIEFTNHQYLITHCQFDKFTVERCKYPIFKCILSAPITIYNELPFPIGIQLKINSKIHFYNCDKVTSVYDGLFHDPFSMKLSCETFGVSTDLILIDYVHTNASVHFNGQQAFRANLKINYNDEQGGVVEIRIKSNYQIVNQTDDALSISNSHDRLYLEAGQKSILSQNRVQLQLGKVISPYFTMNNGIHGELKLKNDKVHIYGIYMEDNILYITSRYIFFNHSDIQVNMVHDKDIFSIPAKGSSIYYQLTNDSPLFILYDQPFHANTINEYYIPYNDDLFLLKIKLINGQFQIHLSMIHEYPYQFQNHTDYNLEIICDRQKYSVKPKTNLDFTANDEKSMIISYKESSKQIDVNEFLNTSMMLDNQIFHISSLQEQHKHVISLGQENDQMIASPKTLKMDIHSPLYQFRVHFRSIGISFVQEYSELLYVIARGIQFDFDITHYLYNLSLMIKYLQVDNQLLDAVNPVMVYPSIQQQDVNLITIKAMVYKENIYFVKLLSLALQETSIDMEMDHLMMLIGYFNDLMKYAPESKPNETEQEPSMMYMELFQINPMLLHVSFEKGESGNVLNALSAFINVHDAEIKLNALIMEKIHGNFDVISNQLVEHYTQSGMSQLYKVVGSVDMLGNPIKLFTNISSGVLSIFYEPYLGIINENPEEIISGLAKGTEMFVKKTVFGFTDSFTKITTTLGKGLGSITLDQEYLKHRRITKNRNKPKHALDGFGKGAKMLGKSVASGISGIVDKPIEGAQQNGIEGLFKGIGQGLLGAISKPLVGLTDMATSIGEGIKSTTTDEDTIERIRYPRFIGKSEPIIPYAPDKSEAQYILRVCDNEKYYDDYYIIHYTTKNHLLMLILSDSHILLTGRKVFKTNWCEKIEDVGICYCNSNNVIIMSVGGRTNTVEFESAKKAEEIAKELQDKLDQVKTMKKSKLVY
eukprot:NODE_51_length_31136_cov_0.357670.p1 type:complete len:2508 gc:universal NODE_51_length_31136_cov_0.357670:12169-4646(-)